MTHPESSTQGEYQPGSGLTHCQTPPEDVSGCRHSKQRSAHGMRATPAYTNDVPWWHSWSSHLLHSKPPVRSEGGSWPEYSAFSPG